MRIAEGLQTLLQMSGMLARLCRKSAEPNVLASWMTVVLRLVLINCGICSTWQTW